MINTVSAEEVTSVLEGWAPLSLAYEWDNVGLQVGTLKKSVSRVMITLDVIEPVVDEAIERGVDLIIAHHPLFFKPLHQLNVQSRRGRILEKLIKNDITVYAAHTNLDVADGGVSDMLADLLGVEQREVLAEKGEEKLLKLAVFVPDSHGEKLRKALGEAGAGHIGNYSHCSFQVKGEGSFQPEEGSTPYLGSTDKLERVSEIKIETIFKEQDTEKVIKSLYAAHPYEEPAYDLIPLANKGIPIGAGRIGKLKKEITVKELCELIKEKWELPRLRVVGDMEQPVKRVAILGGSGEGFISAAKAKKADVYITGDLTFHDSQDAWQEGVSLIDAGHYAEKVMKTAVKDYLESNLKNNRQIDICISQENSNPFQYI